MNASYITPHDWQEFIRLYPAAWAFLIRKSNVNELATLKHELTASEKYPQSPDVIMRRTWVAQRIADLSFFDNMEPSFFDTAGGR